MPEVREVNIKLDDAFTGPVCDFSVGFLRFRKDDKGNEVAIPVGTGTFAKMGRVYGIVTAGHVLEPLKEGVVGLVRFPSIEPALQNFRLDLGHTERIMVWNGKDGDAPDLAFLKIPELDARKLEAMGAVFYNLGLERKFGPSKAGH